MRGIRDFGPGDYLVDPAWRVATACWRDHNLVFCLDPTSSRWTRRGRSRRSTRTSSSASTTPATRGSATAITSRSGGGRWTTVAGAPNTIVKISRPRACATTRGRSTSWRPWVLACIELFGVERSVMGTNWPVDRLYSSYGDVLDAYEQILVASSRTPSRRRSSRRTRSGSSASSTASTRSLRKRSTTSSSTSIPRPTPAGGYTQPSTWVERLADQLVLHRVGKRLELEQPARRRAEGHRDAGCADDARRPGVGVCLAVVCLDAVADLLEAGDPLGAAGVDADDVDGAGGKHTLEALDRPLLLAVGDRRGRSWRGGSRTPRGPRHRAAPRSRSSSYSSIACTRLTAAGTSQRTAIPQSIMIASIGAEPLSHRPHVLDVTVVLEPEAGVTPLAEPDLHALEAGRQPLLCLVDHLRDRRVVCVTRRDRRQPLVDGPAEKVEDAPLERLSAQVPERDVDRGDRVRVDAAAVAVPPALRPCSAARAPPCVPGQRRSGSGRGHRSGPLRRSSPQGTA